MCVCVYNGPPQACGIEVSARLGFILHERDVIPLWRPHVIVLLPLFIIQPPRRRLIFFGINSWKSDCGLEYVFMYCLGAGNLTVMM